MFSRKKINALNELQYTLDSARVLNFIQTISNLENVIFQYIQNIVKHPEGFSEKSKGVDGLINAINTVKHIPLSQMFVGLSELQTDLDKSISELPEFANSIRLFANELNRFEDSYQDFIRDQNTESLYIIVDTAGHVSVTRRDIAAFVNETLTQETEKSPDPHNKNSADLSLEFSSVNEYTDVYEKLKDIEDIYKELCQILNISYSEHPIRIIKIETGSLLVEIIGSAAVIGFFIWILKESVKFYYRNYTLEGQITNIPRELETADKVLKFSQKLEEAGIDTSKNKEQIQKVLFTITDKLNNLVADQPKVTINDQTISVGDEYEQKFLEESKTHLIGDGSGSEASESAKESTTNG